MEKYRLCGEGKCSPIYTEFIVFPNMNYWQTCEIQNLGFFETLRHQLFKSLRIGLCSGLPGEEVSRPIVE